MDLGCFHKYIAFYAYINCCKTNSSLRVEIFEHFLNTETVMKSSKPLSISICDYLKRFDSGLRQPKSPKIWDFLFYIDIVYLNNFI